MKILILDDDKIRHDTYDRIYMGHSVRHAYTYYEFMTDLDRGSPWDVIHLDHDLGDLTDGDYYYDGWGCKREYNGQHASLRICELQDDRLPKQVIVQSVNPDGARTIAGNLKKRGVPVTLQPFTSLLDPRIP